MVCCVSSVKNYVNITKYPLTWLNFEGSKSRIHDRATKKWQLFWKSPPEMTSGIVEYSRGISFSVCLSCWASFHVSQIVDWFPDAGVLYTGAKPYHLFFFRKNCPTFKNSWNRTWRRLFKNNKWLITARWHCAECHCAEFFSVIT